MHDHRNTVGSLPLDPFRMQLETLKLPRVEKETISDDRGVNPLGAHLQGKLIALILTGSIASYKGPEMVRMLRRYGAEVDVYLTKDASRLVSTEALRWAVGEKGGVVDGELTGNIEHLNSSSGARFDAYLVCPATHNIINKVANGIADEPVSTLLAGALGRLERSKVPLVIVPTMNGDMVTSPLFRSLGALEEAGAFLVHPRTENGKWELPDMHSVILSLCRQLSASPVANKAILLTGGPTPVRVDRVRVVTNIFRGALGECIAHELIARGAHLKFLFGGDMGRIPGYMKPFTSHYHDFDEYLANVQSSVSKGFGEGVPFSAGIFSAAVADYRPEQMYQGKIASGAGEGISLPRFVPTPKVIDEVRKSAPNLPMITFKLMVNVSEEDLLAEARRRLSKFQLVVANRLEDLSTSRGTHSAWLVTEKGAEKYQGTKQGLASRIVDHLEVLLTPTKEVA